MAIKSIKDLPKGKRATERQADVAKKAKPVTTKAKNLGRKQGRLRLDLGTHNKNDVAGVVKGFRQRQDIKPDFGTVLMDTDGNVVARTHVARGTSSVPEQLAVKAISKYAKTMEDVRVIVIIPTAQFETKRKAPAKKAPAKKAKKAPAKKAKKAPAKKAKKAPAKKAKKLVKKGKKK